MIISMINENPIVDDPQLVVTKPHTFHQVKKTGLALITRLKSLSTNVAIMYH